MLDGGQHHYGGTPWPQQQQRGGAAPGVQPSRPSGRGDLLAGIAADGPIPPELLRPIAWADNRLCQWCGDFCNAAHIERCPRRMGRCGVCREEFFAEAQPRYPTLETLGAHEAACERAAMDAVMVEMARRQREEEIWGPQQQQEQQHAASQRSTLQSASNRRSGSYRTSAERPAADSRRQGYGGGYDDGGGDNEGAPAGVRHVDAATLVARRLASGGHFGGNKSGAASDAGGGGSVSRRNTAEEPEAAPSSSGRRQTQQQQQRADDPLKAHHPGESADEEEADVKCPWCSKMAPPSHERKCPQRKVKCKHCGQQMTRSDAKSHSGACPAKQQAKA